MTVINDKVQKINCIK